MARIRKRGKNWEYEIKQNGKIVARGSGFSRKKDAERDARKVELSIGNQSLHYELEQDMTLVELLIHGLILRYYLRLFNLKQRKNI